MTRLFTGLFVVGGLAAVFAVLALPAMLASRDNSERDYKNEMASWHIEWGASREASDRRALLPELDEIRPKTGSVAALDTHRIYANAHVIYSQAEDLAASALESAAALSSELDAAEPLTCASIGSVTKNTGNEEVPAELLRASEACALFGSAGRNLVIVRAQAMANWLGDEVRSLSP